MTVASAPVPGLCLASGGESRDRRTTAGQRPGAHPSPPPAPSPLPLPLLALAALRAVFFLAPGFFFRRRRGRVWRREASIRRRRRVPGLSHGVGVGVGSQRFCTASASGDVSRPTPSGSPPSLRDLAVWTWTWKWRRQRGGPTGPIRSRAAAMEGWGGVATSQG